MTKGRKIRYWERSGVFSTSPMNSDKMMKILPMMIEVERAREKQRTTIFAESSSSLGSIMAC